MSKFIEMSGNKIGRLLILERSEDIVFKSGIKKVAFHCLCDCGKTKIILSHSLRSGLTKSCGCMHKEKAKVIGLNHRSGTKNISGTYWKSVILKAAKRGIEVKINIDYIQSLLEKQNFKCALSDIDLICDINNTYKLTGKYDLNTASLDRIDSSKGYIEGNVQWVHKDINIMKNVLPQEKFLFYCKKIVDKN